MDGDEKERKTREGRIKEAAHHVSATWNHSVKKSFITGFELVISSI